MGTCQFDLPPIFYLSKLKSCVNTSFNSAVWIICCPNKNVCFNPIPDTLKDVPTIDGLKFLLCKRTHVLFFHFFVNLVNIYFRTDYNCLLQI